MHDSIRHSAFSIRHFLNRLFRRRARQLRELAHATGAAASPLTMTEVRHAEFSVALPGVWHERRRTRETCDLEGPTGSEGLTIAVRKLAIPVPEKDLPAVLERLLGQRKQLLDAAGGGESTWGPPEIGRRNASTQARCDGYLEMRRIHYALLERVSRDKVLSALLWTQGSPLGGTAFSNLAGVIFDRLDDR
jgi:hypothetical protein